MQRHGNQKGLKNARAVHVNTIFNAIATDVADNISKELAKELRKWAKAANRNVQMQKGLKAVNEIAAEGARRAAYNAYMNSGIGKGPSYRWADRGKWQRYSNGAMENALLAPEVIVADKNGISYINKGEMDKYAKQWYRLNFGTGNSGQIPTAVTPMEFFDIPLRESPSLKGNNESPAFTMPEGIWSSTFAASTIGTSFAAPTAGGSNAFYAIGKRNPRPKIGKGKVSRGRKSSNVNQIRGASFLEAGVNELNRIYPELLEKLFVSWLTTRQ